MIIEVVGKEIEKLKGDFESYLNGLNMVGEISYSQYSELYDEGTKQIQKAYELGKAELEKENAELKADNDARKFAMAMSEKVEKQLREENADFKEEVNKIAFARGNLEEENAELKERADKADLDSVLFFNQLCKAKKLLKKVVTDFHNMDCVSVHIDKTIAEAEQFLSEVEK